MRVVLALVVACAVALVGPAGAGAGVSVVNPPPFDHVHGGNVTPPGNSGHVPATALAAALAGTYRNENLTDQRDLYVAFGRKDWAFATPGQPREGKDVLGPGLSPRPGVTIYRDGWGVPRIFGETDADAQFGVGYAVAQDRMFQADVFRHVARGEMAEFLGGQSWYDYDRAWRAEFYTDAELHAMLERFYTDEEQALLQAYLDGINAYIAEALTDPRKLPAEYVALGIRPEPWSLSDSLAIFVLQARDSVEGFGQELFNAALLADLEERLGVEEGRKAFGDVRFYRDPGAYTTAPKEGRAFAYPGGGFEGLDAPGVALPDRAGAAAATLGARDAAVLRALETVGLARRQASNAIPVSGDITADGRPILLGGPQLAYLVPGIFHEFEVHSPNQHARGIGFAGTAGVVLIGKSPTHAWSITYGYTDQIDVFLVPLDPARPGHYLRAGQSRPLQTYTSTVRCKADQVGLLSPSGSDLCDGAPVGQTDVVVRRVPEYGPVIGEVTVGGQPHAVVKVRGHWMREVQNGRPFMTFNRATTIEQFRAAQADFNISLNINYVDDRGNAGFWHVASPPIRAQGTDVRLPTLGDGRHDWRGFVPLADVPHAINPSQGFTANWNNQIAEGWHNGDQNYWGDLQRVEMLARRMEALAARGGVTPQDVWQVNQEAALEDGRWFDFLPLLRNAFAEEPTADATVREALALVAAWDGQRSASAADGKTFRYDDAAVGIFDRFVQRLQRDVLADDLGRFYAQVGPDFAPAFYHLKSTLLLKILLGERAPLPAAADWLDGVPAQEAIRAAFAAAVADLGAELGGEPESWRTKAVLTTYLPVGLGRVAPHPFLNRGTYNQLAVVDVVAPQRVEPTRATTHRLGRASR